MKTVCAWCKCHIAGDEADPVISHGICRKCFDLLCSIPVSLDPLVEAYLAGVLDEGENGGG